MTHRHHPPTTAHHRIPPPCASKPSTRSRTFALLLLSTILHTTLASTFEVYSNLRTVYVRLECNPPDPSICPQVMASMQFSANALERTIVFSPKEPLRVLAKFESFCQPAPQPGQTGGQVAGQIPNPAATHWLPHALFGIMDDPLNVHGGEHFDPALQARILHNHAAYMRGNQHPNDSLACRSGRIAECIPGGWFHVNLPLAIPRATNPQELHPWYVPQALMRHLQIRLGIGQIQWKEWDIKARFNADESWYVPGVHAAPAQGQYDLNYVAVHELVHGTGCTYNTFYPGPVMPKVLVPRAFTKRATGKVVKWGYHQVFGRHVRLRAQPELTLADLVKRMQFNGNPEAFGKEGVEMERLLQAYAQNDPEGFKMAQMFYAAATHPETLSFYIPPTAMHPSFHQLGKKTGLPPLDASTLNQAFEVLLETHAGKFTPGSSLTHISSTYTNTSDFLMVARVAPGITLQGEIARTGAPATGIGPRVIGMLSTLGYTLTSEALGVWEGELRAGRNMMPPPPQAAQAHQTTPGMNFAAGGMQR